VGQGDGADGRPASGRGDAGEGPEGAATGAGEGPEGAARSGSGAGVSVPIAGRIRKRNQSQKKSFSS